ncbi:MAG TPA: type II CAAX endopeptidase family protein [Candidatus Dormibacteraeota bacterium]|nr:type II CAAX endopeptidase family protein [Candidatus Dormibacteraeota bacterium]
MIRRPMIAFFVFAYALTWIPTALILLATQFGILAANAPVASVAGRLISFGPAIAALIVTAVVAGRVGVGQLLRRVVQGRVGLRWYLIVLAGVPAAFLLGASLLFGGAPFRASAGQWQTALILYLPTVVVAALTTGLGEEMGWRGFALPRLQLRYGPLVATLILGILWGLWHAPNIVFQHMGPQTFGLFLLETLGDAFILTWVYNNTRGSLLLVILLHAVQDKTFGILGLLMPSMTIDQGYLLFIVVDSVALLVILALTRGTLSYDARRIGRSSAPDLEPAIQRSARR